MKRILIAGLLMLSCITCVFSEKKEKTADEVTKYKQQIQALFNKRQEYIQIIQGIDIEIIKLEAIVQYIESKKKEIKDK